MGENIMPQRETSIKVFKGKTAGTLYWLKKEECEDCPAYSSTKVYEK